MRKVSNVDLLVISIQSFSDVITNSSSELFVANTDLSEKEISKFLSMVSYGYDEPFKFSLEEYRRQKKEGFDPNYDAISGWFVDTSDKEELYNHYFGILNCGFYFKKPKDILFRKQFFDYAKSIGVNKPYISSDTLTDEEFNELVKYLKARRIPKIMKVPSRENIKELDGKYIIFSEDENSMPYETFDIIKKILNAERYHLG